MRKVDRVAHFLTVDVSLHNAIKGGTLPGLSVSVVATDCIDLDVESIRLQEFLIDVAALLPESAGADVLRHELPAVVIRFPEEDIVA